ncbi:unnamed protein product, partial [Pleuronectes platessa]
KSLDTVQKALSQFFHEENSQYLLIPVIRRRKLKLTSDDDDGDDEDDDGRCERYLTHSQREQRGFTSHIQDREQQLSDIISYFEHLHLLQLSPQQGILG